jgi:hypothetical protein
MTEDKLRCGDSFRNKSIFKIETECERISAENTVVVE